MTGVPHLPEPSASTAVRDPVRDGDGRPTEPRQPTASTDQDQGLRGVALTVRRLLREYFPSILAFGLVTYLAMRGGGYDDVVRGQAGALLWLLLLAAAVVGMFPARPFGRTAGSLILLFSLFVAWTALSLIWTESAERTATEVARLATYLGIFILAVGLPGHRNSEKVIGGVAAAIALVGALALLSRLHPAWFPPNDLAESQPLARARLAYPVDAWNGLATLLSLGLPLLLAFAVHARHALARAMAAASLPVLALAIYLTFSRGGLLALAIAFLAFVLLTPRRGLAVAVLALASLASAVLIYAVTQRDALADGLTDGLATDQGNEVLLFTLLAVAGVGLLSTRLEGIVARLERPLPSVSRPTAAGIAAAALATALVAAIVLGAPGKLSQSWEDFKEPSIGQLEGSERFASLSGNGRYQYWGSALDAAAEHPLNGIGAGTYEFWWTRNGDIAGFVRDAHSLYLETFAEEGVLGLLLLLAFVAGVIVVGARGALAASGARRGILAGGVSCTVAFSVALAFDWGWEIAAIPAAYLLVAGALAIGARDAAGAEEEPEAGWRPGRRFRRERLTVAVLAVPAVAVISVAFVGAMLLNGSESAYREGDFETAMDKAEAAQDVQPYAASPYLQEALLRESTGDLHGGAEVAQEAVDRERTNWRTWLTLSRIRAGLNTPAPALDAYREARELNPRSVLVPDADPRDTHPEIFQSSGG